ncbi:hypothetical protein KJ885_04505 [Patescibacteria group bacterium]|nr:hypothetical protein [Patescibacteria group bacterium]
MVATLIAMALTATATIMVFGLALILLEKYHEKRKMKQETHHNEAVWVNTRMEPFRKEQCMCLSCAKMKPGESDHCKHAAQFYKICCEANCALIMTRCREWEKRER